MPKDLDDYFLAEDPDAKNEMIGKYRLMAPIGSGGMGVVYRARDPEVGRDVAIKVLKKLPHTPEALGMAQRFKLEARSAGNLRHPNIVTIYEANLQGDSPYIVMELVEGEGLDAVVQRQGRLSPSFALHFLGQIAGALDYAHSKGVVHRDLKPSNILIDKSGNAFILDFGIASLSLQLAGFQNQVNETKVLGTPGYMSPEQLMAEDVDYRTDIFSLGVITFELLTGRRPFNGNSISAIIEATVSGRRPKVTDLVPDLAPALEELCDRALARQRASRYQSAQEMVEDFRRALPRGAKRLVDADPKPLEDPLSFKPKGKEAGMKIEIKAEMGSFSRPPSLDLGMGSPWGTQRRRVSEYTKPQFDRGPKTPGSMFAEPPPSSPRRSTIPDRRSFNMPDFSKYGMVIVLLLVGVALVAILLTGKSDPVQIQPIATNAAPSPTPLPAVKVVELVEPPYSIPPANVAAPDMKDLELVGVVVRSIGSPEAMLAALREARRRKLKSLVDTAAIALRSKEDGVRGEAVAIIVESKDRRAAEIFVTLLEDRSPDIRLAVARALPVIVDRALLEYIQFRFLAEPDGEIKQALKESIESMSGLSIDEASLRKEMERR